MITQQQIDSAPDALALQRLALTLQRDGELAVQDYRAANEAATEAYRAAQLAAQLRSVKAAEATLAVLQAGSAGLPSREQQAFADLFALCLEARRVPLSTATSDATLADIMRDAIYMATFAWPTYKAQLDAVAAAPAVAG